MISNVPFRYDERSRILKRIGSDTVPIEVKLDLNR